MAWMNTDFKMQRDDLGMAALKDAPEQRLADLERQVTNPASGGDQND